jgi:ribonucleoside-diphosphate reductase alpha chain
MNSEAQIAQHGLLPTPPVPEDLPAVQLTENARQVLLKRYVRRGEDGKPAETVEEMFWRVAYHVAKVESTWNGDIETRAIEYYNLLSSKKFFPNSPTFTGAGTPLGQLAACFVLPITDDMGKDSAGIFTTLRNAALIQQTGGGNGFSFSRLRPKGSRVISSAGQATGPVGFLRVYDHAFGEVAQGGTRRGANMAVLRVDHPDIEDFVSCKTNENAITNFNISVGITDAFMQAVEDDADWNLVFPDISTPEYRQFKGNLNQAAGAGIPLKVYKTIKARELFQQIVTQAHHNGEPGMLFLDAANRSNPVPHLYALEATNPCFIGSTRISTDQGMLTLAELADRQMEFMAATDDRTHGQSGLAFRPALPVWKTRENTPVFSLETGEGYSVTATADHQFFVQDRGYIQLKDLTPGDRLLIQSGEGAWSRNYDLPNQVEITEALSSMALAGDHASGHLVTRRDFAEKYDHLPTRWSHALGFILGTLSGDGWLSPTSNSPLGMVFGKDNDEARDFVQTHMQEWFDGGHSHERESVHQLTYGHLPANFFASLGFEHQLAPFKTVPAAIWTAPREAVIGYLQGLFTADGTVNLTESKGSCSVRLASASVRLLQEVQLLLINLGIAARIHLRREGGYRILPDGKGGKKSYLSSADYELIIDKINRDAFIEKVGFLDSNKQNKAAQFIRSKKRRSNREDYLVTVKQIIPAGNADVYDFTEPITHSLIANGLVAHNCGEQWLGPYENCCLGSINLAEHFGPDGTVDWETLRQSVVSAVLFLDDVIEANAYVPAVPQLETAAHKARRIGLGIMGLADLMYHTGIRYGDETSLEFASQVMEFVRYHAMRTSVELAANRGPFPAIEGSIYDPKHLTWIAPEPIVSYTHDWDRPTVDWEEVKDGILKYGIRNAAQTTVAPTGTIATVAGCEGYGCEPVFALAYIRHVNDNGQDLQLNYVSPQFEAALGSANLEPEIREEIVNEVISHGSCQDVLDLPEGIRYTFVVSGDISAEEHVRMQAALQAFVDNSLSKTVNFPAGATEEDVATAYTLAWKLGCKGITVYVTGSRDKVVLETNATASKKKADEPALLAEYSEKNGQLYIWHDTKKPRPRFLKGYTYSIETPLGKTFVTINENGGDQPFEVFISTAKAGSDTAAVSEAIGRLISFILRLASPVEPRTRLKEVFRQLAGIGGGRSLGFGPNRVRSLPDGVSHALDEYLTQYADEEAGVAIHLNGNGFHPEETGVIHEQPMMKIGDLCPECGQAAVINEEGCRKCYSCGYSEC